MKSFLTLPENKDQYNDKVSIIKRLKQTTWGTQAVSAITEGTIFYVIAFARLQNHVQALTFAIVVTFIIEFGQRALFHPTARAIIKKKWTGIEAWFSMFLLVASLALLLLSTLASTTTVQSALRHSANVVLVPIDSISEIKNESIAFAETSHKEDLKEIKDRYSNLIVSTTYAYQSKINKEMNEHQRYVERDKRNGTRHITKKNNLKRKADKLALQRDQEIKALNEKKALEIEGLNENKSKLVAAAIANFDEAKTGIEAKNRNIETGTEKETKLYSVLGILLIIFCQLWLAIVIVLDELFKIIAGITHEVVPEQSDLEDNIFIQLWQSITGLIAAHIREGVIWIRQRTPQPKPITEMPVIYEYNTENRKVKIEYDHTENEPVKFKPQNLDFGGEIKRRKPKTEKIAKKVKGTAHIDETFTLQEVRKAIEKVSGNRRVWKSNYEKGGVPNSYQNFMKYDKEWERLKAIREKLLQKHKENVNILSTVKGS